MSFRTRFFQFLVLSVFIIWVFSYIQYVLYEKYIRNLLLETDCIVVQVDNIGIKYVGENVDDYKKGIVESVILYTHSYRNSWIIYLNPSEAYDFVGTKVNDRIPYCSRFV